jgi:hypothetical protein
MKAIIVSFALLFCLLCTALMGAAADIKATGSFTSQFRGGNQKLTAVFTPVEGKTNEWKAAYTTQSDGQYRGTVTGDLYGDLSGTASSGGRSWRFTAKTVNGVLKGDHWETTGGRETNHGTLTLTVEKPADPNVTPPAGVAKAFEKIEAENYDDINGAQTENNDTTVGYFDSGDYLAYNNLIFNPNANAIDLVIASGTDGGKLEIRLDTLTGTKIGEYTVAATGGWTTWKDVVVPITPTTGTHNLYIVGTSGAGICNFDRFSLVLVKDGTVTPATPAAPAAPAAPAG